MSEMLLWLRGVETLRCWDVEMLRSSGVSIFLCYDVSKMSWRFWCIDVFPFYHVSILIFWHFDIFLQQPFVVALARTWYEDSLGINKTDLSAAISWSLSPRAIRWQPNAAFVLAPGKMKCWMMSLVRFIDSTLGRIDVFLPGMRAMDPYGQQEASRTALCLSTVQSSPTVAGSAWGKEKGTLLPAWLQELCNTRWEKAEQITILTRSWSTIDHDLQVHYNVLP